MKLREVEYFNCWPPSNTLQDETAVKGSVSSPPSITMVAPSDRKWLKPPPKHITHTVKLISNHISNH